MTLDEKKPPDIAESVHRVIRNVTGVRDPYKEVKEKQNQAALSLYPELEERVKRSEDTLLTAAKLAIAGNVIDLGPGHEIEIEKTIERVLAKGLSIDHYERFKEAVTSAETVFFLGDNAGEIVFDKVLLKGLEGKEITYFVKGGPKLNDAMEEDARSVGIDKIANIDIVSNGEPNNGPKRDSKEFIERMRAVDLVISKGQGNYEALSGTANIFFLLIAKCPVIAEDLGVDVGDIILK